MTTITLTPDELGEADRVAHARRNEDVALGRPPAYGANPDVGVSLDLTGARGERAVAKLLGLPWDGNLGNLEAADVAHFQVRTTTHPRGRLMLHPRDNDDDTFFFVLDRTPHFDVVGTIRASDGKRPEFWADPSRKGRPAFFVPRRFLNTWNPQAS